MTLLYDGATCLLVSMGRLSCMLVAVVVSSSLKGTVQQRSNPMLEIAPKACCSDETNPTARPSKKLAVVVCLGEKSLTS